MIDVPKTPDGRVPGRLVFGEEGAVRGIEIVPGVDFVIMSRGYNGPMDRTEFTLKVRETGHEVTGHWIAHRGNAGACCFSDARTPTVVVAAVNTYARDAEERVSRLHSRATLAEMLAATRGEEVAPLPVPPPCPAVAVATAPTPSATPAAKRRQPSVRAEAVISIEALRLAREHLVGFGLFTGCRETRRGGAWSTFGTSQICGFTRSTVNVGGRPISLATGQSTEGSARSGMEHAIHPRDLRRLQDLLDVPEHVRSAPVDRFLGHTHGAELLGRPGDPELQDRAVGLAS